jgi:hypothetical protein
MRGKVRPGMIMTYGDYITELVASRQEQEKKTEMEKKWVQEENYIHVEEKGKYIN